ncbi:EF-P beta-lysylation protein EpmB [Aestuariibacter salexigens]|uniref:EF-P beta-lysylation protein EpmB n=1 Tax=Aestuariibacter salexigens TaxID=226010 RepID=UPI000423353C|nr:EF-P beta-lysylation protein EpmB [Aestuariibacter salexigens]
MAQIIQKNLVTVEQNWQKELAQGFTTPKELLEYLELSQTAHQQDSEARRLFPMRVPRSFVQRMQKGNWDDPLLRQVMPHRDEFLEVNGFSSDPVQEQSAPQKGLLHKYASRVLLMVRTGCAVNCRYCFRRHFPYAEHQLNKRSWEPVFDYIRTHQEVNEVIYSGGDPLMADDNHLEWMTTRLADIPHLTRLRIHTRLPVVLPSRVTTALLSWLTRSRLKPIMVLHINHANEINAELKNSLASLRDAGVTLLNQAVLLKGINDSANDLVALHEALFEADVLPYYLHMLDKVSGAAHFDVDEHRAREIMADVIRRQPGYLVPKLVREIGGQPGKTPVDLQLHT